MADEREGRDDGAPAAANEDKVQSPGRKENDAKPLNSAPDEGGPERYPAVRQDDAVERTGRTGQVTGEGRSFDPGPDPGKPRQGEAAAKPGNSGKVGPGGKPAQDSSHGFGGKQDDPTKTNR
jgi:hypothetical protein